MVHSEQGTGPALTVVVILVVLDAPYSQARASCIRVSPGYLHQHQSLGTHRPSFPQGTGGCRMHDGDHLFFPHRCLRLVTVSAAELKLDQGISPMSMEVPLPWPL